MPIKLYGGLPLCAVHRDWQDGNDTLLSVKKYNAALVVTHAYSRSGAYEVLVSASDASGQKAIFDVVLVINGKQSVSIGSILNTPLSKTLTLQSINGFLCCCYRWAILWDAPGSIVVKALIPDHRNIHNCYKT